jgi:hypothetical protein
MNIFNKLFFIGLIWAIVPVNAGVWMTTRFSKPTTDPKIYGCKNWETVGILSSDSAICNTISFGLVMGQATGQSDKTSLNLLKSLQIQAAMIGGNYIRLIPMLAGEKKAVMTQYAEVLATNVPTIDLINPGEYEVRSIFEYHRTEANRSFPEKIETLPSTVNISKESIKADAKGILYTPLKIYGIRYLVLKYQIIAVSESDIIVSAKVQRGTRVLLYNVFLHRISK